MLKLISAIVVLLILFSFTDYPKTFSPAHFLSQADAKESMPKEFQTVALGLPVMEHPKDNPPTAKKIALGRKLFMDRRLSHNNTISCGMCHVPEEGFTSNQIATAVGIEGRSHRRNSPTMFNVGYYEFLFHDGREFTLEDQVIAPMVAFNEMNNPAVGHAIEKIRNAEDYAGLFEEAFGGPVNLQRLTQAIAVYERTLISGNSRFDQWHFGGDKKAMNEKEVAGFEIFKGKAKCIICHTIGAKSALFTDQSFHNTGIGWARNNKVINNEHEEETFPVQLAPGVVVHIKHDHLKDSSEKPQNDVGRFEITENPDDSWKYKTPGLRNLVVTAPYMHDGSLSTLEDVVDFYDKGGDKNPSLDPLMTPLGLTVEEKSSLVAFLKTLTGDNVEQLEQEAREAFTDVKIDLISPYQEYAE